MSTSAAVLRAGGPRKAGVSTWENLRGLWPYLGRYTGAIALGMVALAIMGLIGVLVPLATGIITDTLAGSARPFEQVAHGATDIGALNRLSNLIPHYQPSSRGNAEFLLPGDCCMYRAEGPDVVPDSVGADRGFAGH